MLEWLEISTELTLVATATRAFLHVPRGFGADPFQAPMCGQGTPETTHWLLEGTIVAAARSFAPERSVAEHRESGSASASAHWAYRLAGYFHSTDATRRLLPVVAQRFARSGRQGLARWAAKKMSEEAGHEQLALRDLEELGYRGRELIEALVPPRARAWVQLFEQLAGAADPVGCVGYAHGLERLALLRGPAEVSAIEQALPKHVNATRCLRVHSSLGSDPDHVRTNVLTASASSASERTAIARACYQTARIYFDPALHDAFDSDLETKVQAFRNRARTRNLTATSTELGDSHERHVAQDHHQGLE